MNEEELNDLKYRQLQKLAKKNGLKANLQKSLLVESLLEFFEKNKDCPDSVKADLESVPEPPQEELEALTMSATPNSGSANPSNQDLLSLFECPVCFDYVLPPILQCHAGHLVCANCRPKLTCCPTCRGQLEGNIRNLAMEKLASTVKFPCRYQSSGCGLSLLLTKKTDHEENCEFRPVSCPCPGSSCKWQGSLEQVVSHLTQVHFKTTRQGEQIAFEFLDTVIRDGGGVMMLQSCFGHHFITVVDGRWSMANDGHNQFFANVQLIGTPKQAENFKIKLELNKQELNGHRRRLTWEATPRSIYEDYSSAIMNSDCLVFDTTIAQLFADKGKLAINVTISN